MTGNNYIIGTDANGKQRCKIVFEWYDENNEYHMAGVTDTDAARTILDLLTGETCLGDLEP